MSDPEDEPRPVVEVTVAAPVEEVWRALREREQLRNWHGWDYEMPDGTDGLAAEIEVIYFSDEVTEQPPARLSLGADVVELTETGDGVRVRLTRGPRGANPDWDAYYDDITEGWTTFLQQLRWYLERHRNDTRVTHVAVGTPREPGPIVARLGLTAIAEQPAGTGYRTTLPMGLPISGTVLFRTAHQLGLTVAGWGDGLLVVCDAQTAAHRPRAGSAAILSTYGLDAATLADLRATVDCWWAGEFEAPAGPGNEPAG